MIPDQELTSKIIGEAIKRSKNTLNKKELIDIVLYKQKQLEICVDEIERLNNIINELEKVLLEYKELCVNYEFDDVYTCEYNYYQQIAIADFIKSFVLNKLQELKGDSSNE